MTTKSAGSVCTGYGGLDMALRLALGDLDEAWFCEIEDGPSQVLAERFPGVKNYRDMTAVDWFKVERPDVVTAGFPCQGNSTAGKLLGREDRRWLWPAVDTLTRVLRPGELFAENVENLLRVDKGEAFADILADLHALGYDVRWAVVGACAAGLSHHRHRVFIRATLAGPRRRQSQVRPTIAEVVPILGGWWRPDGGQYALGWPKAGEMIGGRVYATPPVACPVPHSRGKLLPTPTASDRNGPGRATSKQGGEDLRTVVCRLLPTTMTADSIGERFADYAPAILRQVGTTGDRPPAPTETNSIGGIALSARFAEWMMALPAGWVTEILDRRRSLKAIGNGVSPAQGALAYRLLAGLSATVQAAA